MRLTLSLLLALLITSNSNFFSFFFLSIWTSIAVSVCILALAFIVVTRVYLSRALRSSVNVPLSKAVSLHLLLSPYSTRAYHFLALPYSFSRRIG